MFVDRLHLDTISESHEAAFYLVLTKEEIEMLKLGKESMEEFLVEHNYSNYEEVIVDFVFPLLDAIEREANGSN